jgi:acetoin utilization protein AcuB
MRLQDIMTTPVETVRADELAEAAWDRMRAARIHHLVVMDGKRIVGVFSDRDAGGTRGASVRSARQVADLMSSPVVTAEARTTIREAANKLRGRVIGCLPVLEAGRLVGVVTISDLLELIGRGVSRPVEHVRRPTLRRRGPRQRAARSSRAA